MATKVMTLEIISPEKRVFLGDVSQVKFPGGQSPFTILPGHAPLISSLVAGVISWRNDDGDMQLQVSGGFVEIVNNKITACVEVFNNNG
ncbi:MAG: F0F1 ATP synthase subunit epsilon [Bacteroidaceae bacterium]|nr:F0F1 ATP synthase subunit epsilon [Bacteroidaceae bacterium]MBQ8270546.1 F0F1 ATP synthase subunit epsilon [Bacteroidaceae bacterium]